MASSTSFIPYLCVAVAAFITTFLAVPLVKRLAIKLDAVDYPSKRRINTKPIPRMGGLAIFFALLIAVLCFAGIDRELRGILLGATIIVVLGIRIFTNVSAIRRFIFKG